MLICITFVTSAVCASSRRDRRSLRIRRVLTSRLRGCGSRRSSLLLVLHRDRFPKTISSLTQSLARALARASPPPCAPRRRLVIVVVLRRQPSALPHRRRLPASHRSPATRHLLSPRIKAMPTVPGPCSAAVRSSMPSTTWVPLPRPKHTHRSQTLNR